MPSISGSREDWASLIQRLKREPGLRSSEADWLEFDYPGWHSTATAYEISRDLRAEIHEAWQKAGGYDSVLLLGHSLGGLIARRAYLLAADGEPSDPQPDVSPWAARTSRIVLFAAINRGVDMRANSQRRLAAWATRILPGRILLEDTFRGSDFVTDLRINWIRHMQRNPHGPYVVQFLGTRDGMVTADDSKDLLAFRTYRSIAGAEHHDLHRLDKARDPEARYAAIRDGVLGAPRVDVQAQLPANDPVRRVVFILHGIRASNNDAWVQHLADTLRAHGRDSTLVVPPTYGYFSALRFALPTVRRRNIRVFQDQYTESLADHPTAQFDFVGHSNGTYMLARSLDHVRSMRFQRVALAGSVLPQDYPWADVMRRGQVATVLNQRATVDWPVGLLCSALHGLFMSDVGTAGVNGFTGSVTTEWAFYNGGHGAALSDANLGRVAAFILRGVAAKPSGLVATIPGRFGFLSRAAPMLIWGALLLMIAGLWYSVAVRKHRVSRLQVVAAVAFVFIVYFVLETI